VGFAIDFARQWRPARCGLPSGPSQPLIGSGQEVRKVTAAMPAVSADGNVEPRNARHVTCVRHEPLVVVFFLLVGLALTVVFFFPSWTNFEAATSSFEGPSL
jgi:hypothetical protein